MEVKEFKTLVFPKRYHVDGYEIEVVECENCGHQLGFTHYTELTNTQRIKGINHWLDIISRGMKEICCDKPHYVYASAVIKHAFPLNYP